jgi:acetyl-CoA synthetase
MDITKLDYKSYEEAEKNFKWSDRWEVFDKDRDHLNIAHECIDRHPKDNIAIRLKNGDGSREEYTFGQMSRWTSQFANMLEKKGINRGDRVGIILHQSLEYYVSFYGTLKRGAVAVPCYALLGPDGIEYRLKTANAKLAIISKDRAETVKPGLVSHLIVSEELIDIIQKEDDQYEAIASADSLALIQFSSGTTGQPKQLLYNHSAVSVTAVFGKLWAGLREGDRYMCTSSPAWGHGIWYGTVAPMIFGNGIGAYSGKFDPVVFMEGLEEFEITVVSAIPRVYQMMMESGKFDDYKLKLKRCSYTGSNMEKEIEQFFLDKLGVYIGANYGNTESGPIVIDFAFDDWKPRIGSSGKPMLGVKLGILDENNDELPPNKTGQVAVWRKGKWNPIGDYGYFDEEGYFWPQGRSDDVIKSSGYRIGPFEIEHSLEQHEAVQRAAAVGSPDKQLGEIVKAFVILKEGYQPTDELKKEIQTFVKTHLSMHEYPKEIEFIDEVPETPDGKLKRKDLKRKEYEKKGIQLPG